MNDNMTAISARRLKALAQKWKRASQAERKRIEAFVGKNGTEEQKWHFLDVITQ